MTLSPLDILILAAVVCAGIQIRNALKEPTNDK